MGRNKSDGGKKGEVVPRFLNEKECVFCLYNLNRAIVKVLTHMQ